MNTLPVFYVSQLGPDALEHNNDCGSASSLMLLRTYGLARNIPVDSFYNLMIPTGDSAVSATHMQTAMSTFGLKTEWGVNTTLEQVFGYLRNKRPVIALIHYAALVDAKVTEKTAFRGAHFLVITGIDLNSVFIDDPYRTDGKTNIEVPTSVFEQAWKDCYLDTNPAGGRLVPTIPITDLGTIPTPPTYTEYYLLVNGINVRASATSNSALVRTIWKSNEPIIRCTDKVVNSYIQLADLSGWVYLPYLSKR